MSRAKAPTKAEVVPGSGWFHVVDRVFATLLVLSVAGHFGLIAAVEWRAQPAAQDDFAEVYRDVWHPFISAPIRRQPSAPAPAESHPGAVAASRPVVPRPKLDRVGLIGVIGAMTGEASSGIDDLIGKGGPNQDIASAFEGVGRVATSGPDTGLRARRGAGIGAVSQLDGIDTGGSGPVDTGHVRGVHLGSSVVTEDTPEPESRDIDRDAMSRFMKAHLRSIQRCYEAQLKLLPRLQGKLAVRITLTPAGRVGDLEVDEDTLGSNAVIGCIRSLVHGWQLPFRPEAESAVQLSWNFVGVE